MSIENLTDQILGFTQEVLSCVEEIKHRGYSTEEAIKIAELGIRDMEVETKHQLNKKLDALDAIANVLDYISIHKL